MFQYKISICVYIFYLFQIFQKLFKDSHWDFEGSFVIILDTYVFLIFLCKFI